jgi:hypothetical protein
MNSQTEFGNEKMTRRGASLNAFPNGVWEREDEKRCKHNFPIKSTCYIKSISSPIELAGFSLPNLLDLRRTMDAKKISIYINNDWVQSSSFIWTNG